MALRDWVSNSGRVATATVATPATLDPGKRPTVATVAGVAVAGEQEKENLATIPRWCRTDCPGLEVIDLPGEGPTAGCVPPLSGSWRRLDHLQECPAMEKPPGPVVPSWCNAGCEHFHKLSTPTLGTVLWCCWEEDSTHWRRVRVDAMNSCPMEVRG